VAVAAAERVSLEPDLMAQIDAAYAASRNIVSMQQDLSRGHPTEIDYLNGAVAALGAAHGLRCPVNEGLTSIIKGMEAASCNIGPIKSPRESISGRERTVSGSAQLQTAANLHPIKK
jgi:ketopantoate reductase